MAHLVYGRGASDREEECEEEERGEVKCTGGLWDCGLRVALLGG